MECANDADGFCMLADRPCHVLNPAYKTIHDGAVDCDHFLLAVLPLDPELNTAVWHEIYRREDQAGEGWKECVRCYKPFIPGSNRQRYCTSCGASAKQAKSGKSSAAIGSGRKQRVALPFRTKQVQVNQGFPDTYLGQDDLLVVLPRKNG